MSALRGPLDDPEFASRLQRLVVAPDGDEFIVGRPDLDRYVAVPEPGKVLIESLRDGSSLTEATERASDVAGEQVDGLDFLAALDGAGLFAAADDGTDDPSGAEPARGVRIGWVDRVPQHVARWLFGRVAWTFYGLAAAISIGLLVGRPGLAPIFDDLWFLTDPVWSMLVMFPIWVALAGVHEMWHWLAGRALGVSPRFRVTHRGIFIVFETDLSRLVTLPRRVRYSPMLAGIAFDTVLLAVSLLLRVAFREQVLDLPVALDRFLGAMVFRQVLVVAWQVFGVAFRSDTYAVLANLLHCNNLHRATNLTLRHRLWGLSDDELAELEAIGPRDREVAEWFWIVHLAGILLMLAVLFRWVIPILFGLFAFLRPNLTSLAVDTVAFWQSLLVVVLFGGQFAVVPLIAARERRQRSARVERPERAPRPHTARAAWAWRGVAVVALVAIVAWVGNRLAPSIRANSDATAANRAAAAGDSPCLPGDRVRIMDFPHISQQAGEFVEYNSNPPTSGPHYGMAVAPGIYNTPLEQPQLVHSLEHGRVAIHYLPDTSSAVVDQLEAIARREAPHVVMAPNPDLETQFALTAFGRIDTFEVFDEDRITRFVRLLRDRYDHDFRAAVAACDEFTGGG